MKWYSLKLHPVQLPYCFSFDSQRGKWQHDRVIGDKFLLLPRQLPSRATSALSSQQRSYCDALSGPSQNQRPRGASRTFNFIMHWKYRDNVNRKRSVLYIIYVISNLYAVCEKYSSYWQRSSSKTTENYIKAVNSAKSQVLRGKDQNESLKVKY